MPMTRKGRKGMAAAKRERPTHAPAAKGTIKGAARARMRQRSY